MGERRVALCGAVMVVALAGCSAPVTTESLVGTYEDESGDARIVLAEDGALTILSLPQTCIDTAMPSARADIQGEWELLDGAGGMRDFIYASPDVPVAGNVSGFQIYVAHDSLYFLPDPDGGKACEMVEVPGGRAGRTFGMVGL